MGSPSTSLFPLYGLAAGSFAMDIPPKSQLTYRPFVILVKPTKWQAWMFG